MNEDTDTTAAHIFSALAHPARLQITRLLCHEPMSVREVATALDLSQSGTSQHLAILARAGILKAKSTGTLRVYSVRGPRIVMILTLVERFCNVHNLRSAGEYHNEEACPGPCTEG
jgi:DNA-binding transcriptional ArsR family regulator